MRLALLLVAACAADTDVYSGVVYDERYGTDTAMDIHVPGDARTDRPAIMLVHGGGWRAGDRTAYTDAAERFASNGYVAATIDYRLVPAGTYPHAVQDVLCALAYLRVHANDYGIDPDRIAITGYSAGGHLAALAGTGFDNPAHAPDCAWGAPGAPNATIASDGVYVFDGSVVADFLGGTRDAVPERYVSASPIENIRPDLPPMLVIHGTTDAFVPVSQAHALVEAMRDAGNATEYLELSGGGHILSPATPTGGSIGEVAADMPEAWLATFDFLARTIVR